MSVRWGTLRFSGAKRPFSVYMIYKHLAALRPGSLSYRERLPWCHNSQRHCGFRLWSTVLYLCNNEKTNAPLSKLYGSKKDLSAIVFWQQLMNSTASAFSTCNFIRRLKHPHSFLGSFNAPVSKSGRARAISSAVVVVVGRAASSSSSFSASTTASSKTSAMVSLPRCSNQ